LKDYNAVLVKLNVGPFNQKLYFPMAVQLILENTLSSRALYVLSNAVEPEGDGPKGRHKSTKTIEKLLSVERLLIAGHLNEKKPCLSHLVQHTVGILCSGDHPPSLHSQPYQLTDFAFCLLRYSHQAVENYIMLNGDGIEKRVVAFETDPEKLDRLQRIWVAYQQKLGETVFSV
jgi:hypothetical protein